MSRFHVSTSTISSVWPNEPPQRLCQDLMPGFLSFFPWLTVLKVNLRLLFLSWEKRRLEPGWAVNTPALLSDHKAAFCWWWSASPLVISFMLLHFSLDTVWVFQSLSPYLPPSHGLVREIQGYKITLLPQMETICGMQTGKQVWKPPGMHSTILMFKEYLRSISFVSGTVLGVGAQQLKRQTNGVPGWLIS